MALDIGGHDITTTAYGLDKLGVPSIIFQFATKTADGHVDGAIEGTGLSAAQEIEQHVACQYAVGPFQKGQQQIVFAARKRHFRPMRIEQTTACDLKRPTAEHQFPGITGAGFLRLTGATQDSADARQQLTGIEGLAYVIVRAKLQTDDAVRFITHGGQHDDGHIGLATQPARDVQTGFTWQHQIQHDKLVMALAPDAPRFPSIACRADTHLIALKKFGKKVTNFAIVIDDKNMRRLLHDPLIGHAFPRVQCVFHSVALRDMPKQKV